MLWLDISLIFPTRTHPTSPGCALHHARSCHETSPNAASRAAAVSTITHPNNVDELILLCRISSCLHYDVCNLQEEMLQRPLSIIGSSALLASRQLRVA